MNTKQPTLWTEKTLLDRCNEVGDCWFWAQSTNSGGHPQAHINGKGGTMVRRWVFTHLLGREIPAGSVVTTSCKEPLCCNPAHLVLMTKGKRLSAAYARGERNATLESIKRLEYQRESGRVRLTLDVAREIRARRGERAEDLAREYAVRDNHIRSIWRGDAWAEFQGSSVFAWRPAA